MTKQELYAENRALKAELARTVAELQAMRARFDELLAQGARNNERLEELTAAVLRRSRSVLKPPAPAAPKALDDASKAAYEARPKPPKLPVREPKPKAARKPTGRKALPAHLPVEEHVFRPDACAHCGGTLLDLADEVVEEKLHVVEAYHRRRVVRRKTCRCRTCGERTTARSLPAPYERSKVTSAWLAWLIHQKFSMLVPLDRLRRDLASQGIELAMSTLVGFIERGADLLEAINGHHWRLLLAGAWMATDGTGLKVLVPTLKAAHNGYLEVYRRDDLVVMQYEPTKDAAPRGQARALQGHARPPSQPELAPRPSDVKPPSPVRPEYARPRAESPRRLRAWLPGLADRSLSARSWAMVDGSAGALLSSDPAPPVGADRRGRRGRRRGRARSGDLSRAAECVDLSLEATPQATDGAGVARPDPREEGGLEGHVERARDGLRGQSRELLPVGLGDRSEQLLAPDRVHVHAVGL